MNTPADYTFPTSVLDEPDALLSLLGTFWARTFAGRDQLDAYCDGVGRAMADADAAIDDALACLSVDAVPAFRRVAWRPLVVRASALRRASAVLFGGGAAYGDGTAYGDAVAVPALAAELPDVAAVEWIFDAVAAPTLALCRGLDFLIRDAAVVFRVDPFADPRLATRPVYGPDGTVVDAELTLWLYRPALDYDDIHDHFGYVLGLKLPSSEGYKALVRALSDAAVLGAAAARIDAIVAAVAGVPVAAAGGEVVEAIGRDRRHLLVLTDRNAYKLPLAATVTVAVGDVLAAGQTLCDAATVATFDHGAIPPGLDALAVGPGLLAPGYAGAITFEDRDVPLVVAADGAGRTRVSFALSGFDADVRKFWDDAHARGVAAGQTLAQLLDVRPDPAGEPTAASLPTTINPLAFLCANFLRSNCFLVRIRVDALADAALGLQPLRLLRRVVPPHTMVFVLVELPVAHDAFVLTPSPTEAVTGYDAPVLLSEPRALAATGHAALTTVGTGRYCQ